MTDYLKSFVKVETEIKAFEKELKSEEERLDALEAKLENSAMTAQYIGTLFAIQKGWKKADAQKFTNAFKGLKYADGSDIYTFTKQKDGRFKCNKLDMLRKVALSPIMRKQFDKSTTLQEMSSFFADENIQTANRVRAWACPPNPDNYKAFQKLCEKMEKAFDETGSKDLDKSIAWFSQQYGLIDTDVAKKKFSSN